MNIRSFRPTELDGVHDLTPIVLPERLITRRRFLIGAGALAVGAITGCGAPGGGAPSAMTSAVRSVTDDLDRQVEIPAQPQRVAMLSEEHAAHVTTLGYVPAGIAWAYGPDFVDRLTKIGGNVGDLSTATDLGSNSPINLEAVAAFNPDLILTWDSNEPNILAGLEAIAPTLAINARENRDGVRYQKARFLADVVGLSAELEAQIAAYQAALTQFRDRHAATLNGLTYTFLDTGDDFNPHMYAVPTFAYNAVLADLGIAPSAAMSEALAKHVGYDEDFGYAQVSVELLPTFDADLVFIGRYDAKPINPTILTVMANTFAATNKQLIRVDSNRWTFHLLQSELDILAELDALFAARPINKQAN